MEQGRTSAWRLRLRQALILAAVCLATLAGRSQAQLTSDRPSDEEHRRRILGVWEDHYQGHRTMTVREDGTATMVVRLSGIKAALYASRLQFEMVWSVEKGRLKKQTTGGQPAGRVKAILKMMGDRVDEPILELTSDSLVLLDKDGKTRYHWRRVPSKS